MKRLIVILFFALKLLCGQSFAQTDSSFLKRTAVALEFYNTDNPVEKVYLHLDREMYLPGDTVWFKAYTVAGAEHGLSAISNILHVELLTGKDSVVSREAILLSSGLGRGNIQLPVVLKPGDYHVRAYTNWMRNAGPDYFFDKTIHLSDIETAAAINKIKAAGRPDVQFFPEGGTFITGLRNKIAVKAIGTNGLGFEVEGIVTDNDGIEVAVFKTSHLGMGSFLVVPQAGKTYSATITAINKGQFKVDLPKPAEDGFALSVINKDADSVIVKITVSSTTLAANKNASCYLIGQTGGKIAYAAEFKLANQSFSTRINKKRFPTGILQFTLYAANATPICERIIFIQHNDNIRLSVNSAKNVYGTRQPVKFELKASDVFGAPLIGNFSVAVVNDILGAAGQGNEDNIYSNLLLTSDIKGYVEQPGYYFNSVNDKTRADLDLLMLTQGYRRFSWKEIIDGTYPRTVFEPENSLNISGNVKFSGSNKPVPFAKIKLLSTKGGFFQLDTVSNKEGRFTFKGLDPDSTVNYMISAHTATNKDNVTVSLDTVAGFKQQKNSIIYSSLADTAPNTAYRQEIMKQQKLQLSRRVKVLKEVVIKARKRTPSAGLWIADQTITNIPEDSPTQSLAQYLSPRLNGITFYGFVPYSNRTISRIKPPPPPMSIILDGFTIDASTFMTLNVRNIESVEVLKNSGKRDVVNNVSDAIIITTKKGVKQYSPTTPNAVSFKSNGIFQEKEFYSPVYNTERINNTVSDIRTTIFWKPDLITDKDGKCSFSFYNADTRGTYRVTLEGIDTEGKLGRQVYTYTVE